MTEYYKLSLLRKTENGAEWENIYFKIEKSKPKLIGHGIAQRKSPLNSKLEKVSEEKIKDLESYISNVLLEIFKNHIH